MDKITTHTQNSDDSEAAVDLKNISRTMLRDQTYVSLKKAILSGKIPQGEKITIRKLAAISDFSSTPIREALLKLEHDGFVVRESSGQFSVRRFSPKEVKQIFELRILLETYGATEAMQNAAEHDIVYLEENVKRSEEALAQGRVDEVSLLNAEFHNYFMGISKNEILQDLLQRISDKVWINTSTALQAHGKAGASIIEHGAIVQAMKKKSLKELKETLRQHILSALRIVMDRTAHAVGP
jgi:DNA-binding GntR family transcriptional regulator